MAEAPEIPEANDPFSKQVAITIALLAVVLAVIENKGDNAKTDAIIKTLNEETNGIVFLLWGNPAHLKARNVDEGRHTVIRTSHVSYDTCNKNLKRRDNSMLNLFFLYLS